MDGGPKLGHRTAAKIGKIPLEVMPSNRKLWRRKKDHIILKYKFGASRFESDCPIRTTTDQIFYISFGQAWCTKKLNKYQEHQFLQDSHDPERFRVLGKPTRPLPHLCLVDVLL